MSFTIPLNSIPILYFDHRVEPELARLGLEGTYFEPILNISIDEYQFWSAEMKFSTEDEHERTRQICRFLTHINALSFIIEQELAPVIILDGNVQFLTDTTSIDITIPNNCNLLYLGGLYWWQKQKDIDYTLLNIREKHYLEPFVKIYTEYFTIGTVNSYLIPDVDSAENILDIIYTNNKKPIEFCFANYVQKYTNAFCIQPSLCIPMNSESDSDSKINIKHYFYNDTKYKRPPYDKESAREFYNNRYYELLPKLSSIIFKQCIQLEPHKTIKYLQKLHFKKE